MDLTTTPAARLGIHPDALPDDYARLHLADLSDEQIFEMAADVVSIPKQEPANSFILHAPLELLARRALLRVVAPPRREPVRERMMWVAATYERASAPAEPAEEASFASPATATAALVEATQQQDLERVDAAASWLAAHAAADDVMALAEPVLDSLAAAGHASIYFFHLSRTAARSRPALRLLRPLAREIARLPQLRIEWIREGVEARGSDGTHLADALARTPRLGLPGSDFIFPTVHQVDSGGRARDHLAGVLPASFSIASPAILRVAAQSMLQDDPAFAPYGWTHCLTLPQAVLGIMPWLSGAAPATAIAATYAMAFRAAEGARDISVDWEPEPVTIAAREALDADPATAASAVYHSAEDELARLVPELAARAGSHEDAHLAKYTLACFDAAAGDPAARRLYLSAAAYLGAWWSNPR